MSFVKLDVGILVSTLWFDRDVRDVFITALLMASPREISNPTAQLEVDSLEETGWIVPAGWYGHVPAAGCGILRMAGMEGEIGFTALKKLGSPDIESRSKQFEGRRLVRIDGGYLVLNYCHYRDKDHTAAQRMQRYRTKNNTTLQNATELQRVTDRNVTHADADADADAKKNKKEGFKQTNEEFLKSLKTKKEFSHINVDEELRKIDLWISRHPGRSKTQRFIVNWLKKVEIPMSSNGHQKPMVSAEEALRSLTQ